MVQILRHHRMFLLQFAGQIFSLHFCGDFYYANPTYKTTAIVQWMDRCCKIKMSAVGIRTCCYFNVKLQFTQMYSRLHNFGAAHTRDLYYLEDECNNAMKSSFVTYHDWSVLKILFFLKRHGA